MNWDEFDKEVRTLGSKIDFQPDIVIGVARGGVIPAALLARILKVKDFTIVKTIRDGEHRKVMADTVLEVAGKKVLLVEDMLETGRSLAVAKHYLEKKGASVKTACLYTMSITELPPDYSLKEVPDVMPFPWE